MLEHAAAHDRFDVMAFLLEAGVDVNASTYAYTPLSIAARDGTVDAVRWLLDRRRRERPGRAHRLDAPGGGGRRGSPGDGAIPAGHGADPDILHGNPQRNALRPRGLGHDEIAEYLKSRGVTEVIVEREPVDVESPGFLDTERPSPSANGSIGNGATSTPTASSTASTP